MVSEMMRNHSAMSISTSCLRMPLNPYNKKPSPSYERRQVVTPNTEDGSSLCRKPQPISDSSHPPSRGKSPVSKLAVSSSCKQTKQSSMSPLDSFLDFYESIPDYQEVTHLSDREFADKMKLLRDKQRQYLQTLDGRYSPLDFEECRRETQADYKKKSCKSVNKLERAKEWVNKSCDSLSSLGRKSESDYRIRGLEEETQMNKTQAVNQSSRKYVQYDLKDEAEGLIMDTGSSLSTESNVLKSKVLLKPSFADDEPKPSTSSNTLQDFHTPFSNIVRSESCQGLTNFYSFKDNSPHYDFYNLKGGTSDSEKKKIQPSSCAQQSSGTSELNVQDFNSSLGLTHHDTQMYDDYYAPMSGWIPSDSDSMLGALHHIPSNRTSTAILSQSLPGSPTLKQVTKSSKVVPTKKKTRRKRRTPQKSTTKPIPFSFMCNERQHSRSTPDLSSHCRSPSPKNFRARPIPRKLFSNYVYQKKQEDEFFRALKRKVRSEAMLRAASLPPSMEFRERLNRVQAEAVSFAAASSSSEQSGGGGGGDGGTGAGSGSGDGAGSSGQGGGRGKRGRPRRPPDFAKCHEKMRQELYERQGRNITTSPSPYSLRTASLSPRRKCLQGSASSDSRRCRPRPRSSGCAGLDVSNSRSNLAALLRIQSARQRLEAEHHRLREEQLRRNEMRLKERLTRLTPAWRSIQYSTEEDLALRAAARRQEERERRREHGVLMRHMLHRVHTIPTLFERQSTSSRSRASPFLRDAVEQCGPGCPALDGLDDDEDAADVKVFVPRSEDTDAERPRRRGSSCRPSRSRCRQRPCSADLGTGSRPRPGRRSACSASPDKQDRLSARSAIAALRSPDRLSGKLRTYHRQLPRVEFSESPALSLRGHGDEDEEDDGRASEDEAAPSVGGTADSGAGAR